MAQATSQASTVTTPSAQQALLQAYQQEQAILTAEVDALTAQGASPVQMAAWHRQNSALFQAQLSRAQQLAAYSDAQNIDYVTEVTIPDAASNDQESLLTANAALSNSFAQIHNQIFQASAQPSSAQSMSALDQSVQQYFLYQNLSALKAQSQVANRLGQQADHQFWLVDPPLTLQFNSGDTFQAYLVQLNEIDQDEINLHNQYCQGNLSTLYSVLQQWRARNISLYMQLSQLAQELSQSSQN